MIFLALFILGALGLMVVASFLEWTVHRFLMHRPLGKFRYPYERHALIHHRIFQSDKTYHMINPKDIETVPMAWWNGPVLICTFSSPFALISWLTGQWAVYFGAFFATVLYYIAYEYSHWCMHLPKDRQLEQLKVFRFLNRHHLLHHRFMKKNFNVVFPLADIVMGTYLAKAPVPFEQVTGPAVPNVQP